MIDFQNLHQQEAPLFICNVWDVASAKIAEKLNFKAIGTSSSAIATMLGYEDGEEISFDELFYIVKRIKASTTIPITVDLESGYSRDPLKIIDHIKQLASLNVKGINIEDSIVQDNRNLIGAHEFAKVLTKVSTKLKKENIDVFINIRTDTYLLGLPNKLAETKKRIDIYSKAGADGIFIPCLEDEKEISSIAKYSPLPINIMCMPNLPDFNRLKALGIKRISMGNFLFEKSNQHLEHILNSILNQKSFKAIFSC